MKKILFTFFITLLLAGFGTAFAADDVYGGNRDAATDSVYSNGEWEGDFKISWEIKQEGSLYHYVYKITDNSGDTVAPNVSHLLLEVSPTVNQDNVNDVIDQSSGEQVSSIGKYSIDENNPGLPDDIYALQFEVQKNEKGEYVVEFYSNRPPVWGDFYAQGDERNFAYNLGFGGDSEDGSEIAFFNGRSLTLWIPVPVTGAAALHAPEPSTWLILGTVLAVVAYKRRKKLFVAQK